MPNAKPIRRRARSAAALAFFAAGLLAPLGAGGRGASASPARVIDDMGRAVEMPQAVRRIVSLAPSVTETLFALGLGDRVVGDTDYCDFPLEAKARPHIGGVLNPNIEAVAALHPDVVVASRSINRLVTVQALERLGIPVYATDANTVEQVLASADRLGSALGSGSPDSHEAARVLAELRGRLDKIRASLEGVEPRRVFFVVWQAPLISVGRNTFLADALRWAGADSVIDAPEDWPEVSLEQLVRQQPDYLIFSSDDPEAVHRQIAQLRGQPGWRDLDALRNGRIIILSEAINHPSPRLVGAIEELARALHPEAITSARFPSPAPGPARPAARSLPQGAF